jgi:hypothetical protein
MNKLGIEWLKHFIKHTEGKVVGARRLLILDGHKSHQSLDFQELYKENNIYTLCMPPHLSHLLQLLDIGCFLLLKHMHSHEIEALICHHINHITKLEFLPAFKATVRCEGLFGIKPRAYEESVRLCRCPSLWKTTR